MKDPIVEETREWRNEYAATFNYDLKAIVADIQKRESLHPERFAVETQPIVNQSKGE